MKKHITGAICAAVLLFAASGCNDFLKGGDLSKDPNNPTSATSNQFFGAVQTNLWYFESGDLPRLTAIWMQQLCGCDRQTGSITTYNVVEGQFDLSFGQVYDGGGMVDLRKIEANSAAVGDNTFLGISQIIEVWLVGSVADIWGDIPYTQADSFLVYPQPVLDPQQAIYDSVQSKLSQGIANLATGVGSGPQGFDLVYNGDAAKWTALAHTLKARFFLHTAEVVGTAAYDSALAEANLGISSNDGDYIANFSGSQQAESNPWYQLIDANGGTGRSGYWAATQQTLLHQLLSSTGDPRDHEYYDFTNAQDDSVSAIRINPTYPQPFVTYNENLLIKAEAQFNTGDVPGALISLNQERAAWATATPWHTSRTLAPVGSATLAAIMNEKYILLFQNMETWNDYKRTCFPQLDHVAGAINGGVIPGRFLYPLGERQTNKNVPDVNNQPDRNWNDPAACPAP